MKNFSYFVMAMAFGTALGNLAVAPVIGWLVRVAVAGLRAAG